MTAAATAPLLFPPPRVCERLEGRVAVPGRASLSGDVDRAAASAALGDAVALDPGETGEPFRIAVDASARDLPPEGYRLRIVPDPERIRIHAAGLAGALHALSTLRQLFRQYGRSLPALRIEDSPCFPCRGVMLDVSRDRVPTMAELLRVVDQLAELKLNHLQLYTEHTFAYAGHEEVWHGSSPVTPAEVRELDAYCRLRGITLAANQNCFGHLASWLRHPRYAHLAEIEGADTLWKFYDFDRRGPFSLCPTDSGSLTLVRDLLSQLLPCFSSGLININCDETADVGQGRTREEVARRGRAAVYFDFVRAVAESARSLGARPMFWADIALSHPESIGLIPEDMICLAWGYEPDAPFGDWCRRLREIGREVWVCPGTSSWRSITGRTFERRANLAAATDQGRSGGAEGFLVTDWGDVGHRQQWPISLHGIAHGAHAAWTGSGDSPDPSAESLHVFGDTSLGVASWLDEVGDADLPLRQIGGRTQSDGKPSRLRNASVLFNDLHPPFEGADRVGDVNEWSAVGDHLAELSRRLPGIQNAQLRDELNHILAVASFAAERGVMRRSRGASGAEARLAARLREILAEHRRLWLLRSRPGGLDDSCRHYRDLLGQFEHVP